MKPCLCLLVRRVLHPVRFKKFPKRMERELIGIVWACKLSQLEEFSVTCHFSIHKFSVSENSQNRFILDVPKECTSLK